MNLIIPLIFGVLSGPAMATEIKPAAEITFTQDSAHPKYWIVTDRKSNSVLFYRDSKKKIRKKVLLPEETQFIRAEIQRLVWDSNYRSPVKASCSRYADLRTSDESAKICRENHALTGRAFGLLNALSEHFRK